VSTAKAGTWLDLGSLHLNHYRGLIVAIIVFLVSFSAVSVLSRGPLSYFDLKFLATGSATLALGAMGETIIVLVGGFDLSVGAVISLVNVVLATNVGPDPSSQILWAVLALALGAAVGAFNGFFVAFMRLQPIVVTLATMFIVQGLSLLVLDKPGGSIPAELAAFFTGDAIQDALPAVALALLVALVVWTLVKRSRLGTAIYAVGGDEEAASARGIDVRLTKFFAYVIGGAYYGAAGLYVTANSSGGDPLVGAPLLLQIFTAVVLGGTVLGGGRGGLLGTLIASFTLATMINALLILNVSAYYSTLVQGVLLITASLASSLRWNGPPIATIRASVSHVRSLIDGTAPRFLRGTERIIPLGTLVRDTEQRKDVVSEGAKRSLLKRYEGTLRLVAPSWGLAALAIAATLVTYGSGLSPLSYINSLLILTSFLAVLGLGQGVVVISGGLDLSIPWTVAFTGVLLTGITSHNPALTVWAIPIVLAIGATFGVVNGLGIVVLGLPPFVMTLALNGILQTAALVYSNATPVGLAPRWLQWFMAGRVLGLAPVAWALVLFASISILLLSRTTFARRLYAIGNSSEAARLSGVRVGLVLVCVYALSGLCSAIVGVMLAGFATMASLGMGDPYLLPSIAVVVVGGTLITGGQGHYFGILGGAVLLTVITTLFAGTTLPQATRDIILGFIVLLAIIALRQRDS
jgi:ribose transport system permease protein